MRKKRKKPTKSDLLKGRVPLDEIAYKYGVYFSRVKNELEHGKFLAWINANTRWSYRTVRNYMNYAEQCERAGYLLKYRPSGRSKGLSQSTVNS